MSDLYEIVSAAGNYKIEVGRDLIKKTVELYPEALYIIDQNLTDRIPASVSSALVIEATEDNKSLESMAQYVAKLRELGANRDTHLVAVGGGIIQDITTFAASIYMRGLSWTYLPTTVLSMVDSCIGGKSSINVLGYKNLVGNFYPPKDIFIDPDFITTLDREMIVGGLFEAAKICYAKSPEHFSKYLTLTQASEITPQRLQSVAGLALSTKKWFIEVDEFDQKERLLLNFGHTFGHAIEAATNFDVHHGVGVGVGMLIACEFAEAASMLSASGLDAASLLKDHVMTMLGGGELGAPDDVDLNKVLEKFDYDKKHRRDFYRVVVPVRLGELELISIPRDAASREAIKTAFERAFCALSWTYH